MWRPEELNWAKALFSEIKVEDAAGFGKVALVEALTNMALAETLAVIVDELNLIRIALERREAGV